MTYRPTDRPDLAADLRVPTAAGDAWRCLRCGAFVPGAVPAAGPLRAAPAPARGLAIRDALILRLLAIERTLRGLALFAVAYGVWRFDSAKDTLGTLFHRYLPRGEDLAQRAGIDLDDTLPVRLAERALRIEHSTLLLVVLGVSIYGVIELIEGIGLWSARRWGEYVAVVATSVFLPYEIYDVIEKASVLRVGTLAVNLAVVVWLVWSKRLFGVRGGGRAFERERAGSAILRADPEQG